MAKELSVGRPSKLTEKFLSVADRVLNQDMNCIICTDEELRFLINEELSEEERVSDRTWEEWKAGDGNKNDIGDKFRALLKRALILERRNLFKKLTTEKEWTKFAWIIERKFDDWNIKNKTDMELSGKAGGSPLTVRIVHE